MYNETNPKLNSHESYYESHMRHVGPKHTPTTSLVPVLELYRLLSISSIRIYLTLSQVFSTKST